jgi:hypothetical protein
VEGLQWLPVRRELGVGAFGVNAFRALREGDPVVEEHEESPGQEELYVVLRGRATFKVGGEPVDAPAGTAVAVPDPETVRSAVAAEDDTVVLAVGGWRDQPYHPLPWEPIYLAMPQMRDGDWAGAAATLEREAGPLLESAPVQYRLACLHARTGEHDRALSELRRAIELNPAIAERARDDAALEPLRALPEWPL